MKKALSAAFEDFFASPSHQKLDQLLRSQGGEYNNLDYKDKWPEHSKLARHILAMGNCGGGVLVIGVKQQPDKTLEAKGLQSLTDKADIYKGVSQYLPRLIEWEVHDFSFDSESLAGKMFQVLLVEYLPHILPLISEKGGNHLRAATVYVRRGTCSEEADYTELQKVINARIETGRSTTKVMALKEHLDELESLYQRIPAYRSMIDLMDERMLRAYGEKNPNYPQESYEKYIAKLIESKKKVIDALMEAKR